MESMKQEAKNQMSREQKSKVLTEIGFSLCCFIMPVTCALI